MKFSRFFFFSWRREKSLWLICSEKNDARARSQIVKTFFFLEFLLSIRRKLFNEIMKEMQ